MNNLEAQKILFTGRDKKHDYVHCSGLSSVCSWLINTSRDNKHDVEDTKCLKSIEQGEEKSAALAQSP